MKQVDFNIKGLFKISFGDFEYYLTTTHVSMLIVSLVILGLAIYVNRKFKKTQDIPTGFVNAVEFLYEMLENFAKTTMGAARGLKYVTYIGTVFIFILVSNLSGALTLRPPTADFGTTLGLALITFVMVQYNAIKANKPIGYVKKFFQPSPLLFPINLIGEVSDSLSLSLRLFGNLLGGTIIMTLFYALTPKLIQFGIPAVLHFYFDIFAAGIQTFVFCMLTMVFVSRASEKA